MIVWDGERELPEPRIARKRGTVAGAIGRIAARGRCPWCSPEPIGSDPKAGHSHRICRAHRRELDAAIDEITA